MEAEAYIPASRRAECLGGFLQASAFHLACGRWRLEHALVHTVGLYNIRRATIFMHHPCSTVIIFNLTSFPLAEIQTASDKLHSHRCGGARSVPS